MIEPASTALLAMDSEHKMVLMIGGLVFATFWIMASNVRRIAQTRSRERTRREIAAYVAEGTIRPEDATQLLGYGDSDAEQKIADAVSWGTLKPEKAERLLRAMRDKPAEDKT